MASYQYLFIEREKCDLGIVKTARPNWRKGSLSDVLTLQTTVCHPSSTPVEKVAAKGETGGKMKGRDGRKSQIKAIMDKAAKAAKEGQSQSFTYSTI